MDLINKSKKLICLNLILFAGVFVFSSATMGDYSCQSTLSTSDYSVTLFWSAATADEPARGTVVISWHGGSQPSITSDVYIEPSRHCQGI